MVMSVAMSANTSVSPLSLSAHPSVPSIQRHANVHIHRLFMVAPQEENLRGVAAPTPESIVEEMVDANHPH